MTCLRNDDKIHEFEGEMAKKKVYAVKKGKETGIFYNWDECKDLVTGYPGAEYKGFFTEEEANDYLLGIEKNNVNTILNDREEMLQN